MPRTAASPGSVPTCPGRSRVPTLAKAATGGASAATASLATGTAADVLVSFLPAGITTLTAGDVAQVSSAALPAAFDMYVVSVGADTVTVRVRNEGAAAVFPAILDWKVLYFDMP